MRTERDIWQERRRWKRYVHHRGRWRWCPEKDKDFKLRSGKYNHEISRDWWLMKSASCKKHDQWPAEHSRFSLFSWEAEQRCVRWVLMRNADETASVEISEYARAGEITFLTASMISLGSPRQHAKCRSVLTPTWAKDDMFVDVTGGAWFIFEDLKIKKEGKKEKKKRWRQTMHARRVDSSTLVFSLSSHRYPYSFCL